MTLTTTTQGYLEPEYLGGPYLTNLSQGAGGFQAQIVIQSQTEYGFQSQIQILDYLDNNAMQVEAIISDTLEQFGFQGTVVVEDQQEYGMQALINLEGITKDAAMQANVQILDYLNNAGFETRIDKYPTLMCEGYLEGGYLEDPYLTKRYCMIPGMQATVLNEDELVPVGMQSEIQIKDVLSETAMQALIQIVDFLKPTGFQADAKRLIGTGMQALATIYNTTNLRIMCVFPSRGTSTTNWTSNSTAPGDFSVQNLDTDIVEQVWRSNGVTSGIRLQTDTGLPQGVFLDTMAILNHNMTRSANVTLLGSDDPTFTIIGTSITVPVREDNIYYIAPTLPTMGYRYWRIDIDDSTNPSSYIEIGTVVFGASDIFQGECFVDEIEFELKDFTDTVRTEGFTNVSNSRTQKRRVRLEFRSLSFQLRNFNILRNLFQTYRTTFKCLWIPTPSATNTEVTARFAVFGKLTQVPSERHNSKGPNADYVSFTIEVDESL